MISYLIIYLVALYQGFMIVLFPAGSAMLVDLSYHNLSSSEYGALFIPLIIGILISASFAPSYSLRSVLCFALINYTVSQGLFLSTAWIYPVQGFHPIIFFVLLFALLFLGLGYGAGLTAINAYIPDLFPNKTAVAMSALYTVSGFGSASAPIIFSYFFSRGVWWWLPVLLGGLALVLALVAFLLPDSKQQGLQKGKKDFIFYSLLVILFLYGFLETTFGNWGLIYLHKGREFSAEGAAHALAYFWMSVVIGRLILGLLAIKLPFEVLFGALPWMIAVAFLLIPEVDSSASLFALFSFAGFACSGCLPFGFALGEKCYPGASASISGALLSAYMLGYGASSYGIGAMHQLGFSFSKLYHLSVIPALIMGFLLLILIQKIWNLRRI